MNLFVPPHTSLLFSGKRFLQLVRAKKELWTGNEVSFQVFSYLKWRKRMRMKKTVRRSVSHLSLVQIRLAGWPACRRTPTSATAFFSSCVGVNENSVRARERNPFHISARFTAWLSSAGLDWFFWTTASSKVLLVGLLAGQPITTVSFLADSSRGGKTLGMQIELIQSYSPKIDPNRYPEKKKIY